MEHKAQIKKEVEDNVKHYVTKGFKIFFFIILGLAIAFLVGYIVMRLWNWLMPELFGLPMVGYWQAVGVLILAKILFGFGGGDGPGKNSKSKRRNRAHKCSTLRKDFSEWKYYDEFWEAEGEQAYNNYIARIKEENNGSTQGQ
ncbi:hypothetical protein [Maribacter sp. 2210JD10-5]|uniref:hypothetical protein n=1 Tax=Maribacter sp. 2210JD10-5 TaxID=3386272 RepID=UPI0039BD2F70